MNGMTVRYRGVLGVVLSRQPVQLEWEAVGETTPQVLVAFEKPHGITHNEWLPVHVLETVLP